MRYHDWPERLFAEIAAAKKTKFAWGEQDCALFVFGCVEAMTGVDYMKSLKGKYRCRRSSKEAFKKIEGAETLRAFADECFGNRIDLSNARRGDVVLLDIDSIESFGIVVGSHAVFLELKKGIQTVSVNSCSYAWRVD